MYHPFDSHQQRHAHALKFLEMLYEFDDFMESIRQVADVGAGVGLDTEWWATRTTRGDNPEPLDIKVTAVVDKVDKAKQYQHKNVLWQEGSVDDTQCPPAHYDLIWCHDQFQYALNPLQSLKNLNSLAFKDSMLCLTVPTTTNLQYYKHKFISIVNVIKVNVSCPTLLDC